MISLSVILGIIIIHWFADFVCQTDWQAQNKSSDWEALLGHTAVYSLVWLFISVIYWAVSDHTSCNSNCGMVLLFAPITFIAHTATDYYTSRANKLLWDQKKVHDFFTSIGFDQVLHYVQLFGTYYILTR